jgi:predicted nucleic acid-binding protein
LINGNKYYEFYSPEYIRQEIIEHQEKIKRIGKLTDNEFIETYELIIRNLSILNHTIIPKKFYKTALELCNSIDVDEVSIHHQYKIIIYLFFIEDVITLCLH